MNAIEAHVRQTGPVRRPTDPEAADVVDSKDTLLSAVRSRDDEFAVLTGLAHECKALSVRRPHRLTLVGLRRPCHVHAHARSGSDEDLRVPDVRCSVAEEEEFSAVGARRPRAAHDAT